MGGLNSVAPAINDRGEVVGHSEIDHVGRSHAFLWKDA
jgi:probable HAF family extracellular repeat protein